MTFRLTNPLGKRLRDYLSSASKFKCINVRKLSGGGGKGKGDGRQVPGADKLFVLE